ncbi:MAG: malate dehydrogenase [Marinilabiliales bacterium]|nr:MAG: malate dehydrogenase [Marinilabiliales bacterium]
MKITVIGAGNVGATCANVIAHKALANQIVLVDVKPGFAEGKALDMWQTAPVNIFDTRIIGVTNDYLATKGSEIIIITSGVPRKPGMSRDDLIATNAKIVKEVTEKAIRYSPDAVIIVVSNPLDVMTYAAYLAANKHHSKVFGMAGILDAARYKSFVAEILDTSPRDVQALLLGGHGDTMVPLPRYTSVSGIPISQLLNEDEIDRIVEKTRQGGGDLVKLIGTSAWYAPGAAVALMVEAIVHDQHRIFSICAYLNGEYGFRDIYLGVPVKLGRKGVEEVIEIELDKNEKKLLNDSANAVRDLMKTLDDMNLF